MLGKGHDESHYDDSATFYRHFRYAVVACATIEFIAITFSSTTKLRDEISWPMNGGVYVRKSESRRTSFRSACPNQS